MQEEYCILDPVTREIRLTEPQSIAGVESDENARELKFKFPKTVDNIDLTQMQVRINFMNSRGEKGQCIVTDLKPCEDEEDYIIFTWPFSRLVTHYRGYTKFVICAVKEDESGTITAEWNTSLAQIKVLEGLEITQADFTLEEKDIVSQLISICQNSVQEAALSAQQAQEEAEKVLNYGPEIGENGNWYLKGEDTGHPSRGEKGERGADGAKGETGAPGKDGAAPEIGANGNWYIDGKDTGKPSRGERGLPGSGGSTIVDLGELTEKETVIDSAKGKILLEDPNPVALVRNVEGVDLLFTKNYVYLDCQAIYSASLLGNGIGFTLFVVLQENQYFAFIKEGNFPLYLPPESTEQDGMLVYRQLLSSWELISKDKFLDEFGSQKGNFREIANFVTDEDALKIEITEDEDGNPFNLRQIVGTVVVPKDSQAADDNTSVWCYIGGVTNSRRTIFNLTSVKTTERTIKIDAKGMNGFVIGEAGTNREAVNQFSFDTIDGIPMISLEVKTQGNKFPAGTQMRLWGIDK